MIEIGLKKSVIEKLIFDQLIIFWPILFDFSTFLLFLNSFFAFLRWLFQRFVYSNFLIFSVNFKWLIKSLRKSIKKSINQKSASLQSTKFLNWEELIESQISSPLQSQNSTHELLLEKVLLFFEIIKSDQVMYQMTGNIGNEICVSWQHSLVACYTYAHQYQINTQAQNKRILLCLLVQQR